MRFRDLKLQYEAIKEEMDQAVLNVLESSQFIQGPQVKELESLLADYVGTDYCIGCANGTDALQLSLMAWGVGPGDAVFTSDFTFFASAGCASIVGATPVLVDIDLDTFNISPDHLVEKIEQVKAEGVLNPKVIIPVDLFGLPAEYDRIEKIALDYGLLILEDAAQSFGGAIRGKRAGSFGDAATTSFFPAKPLGCYGDGGAIFTNDKEFEILLRSLQAQGRSPEDKYDNRLIGMNSRLDTLQAAILIEKLKVFRNYELEKVNEIARLYTEKLSEIVKTPSIPEGYLSSWAQYTILLDSNEQRDGLQEHLKGNGIPSMIYYPKGLHQQSAYANMNLSDDEFPNAAYASKHVLSLPMHPYMQEEDVERVVNSISKFINS